MVYKEHKFLYPCFKHSKNIAVTCKGLTSLLKNTIENQKPATRTVQYMLKAINSQCMLDTNTYFSVATESFHVSVPSFIIWAKLVFYLLHALSFFSYYRYHNLTTATTHDQIKFILTTPVSHLQNGFRTFSFIIVIYNMYVDEL